MTAVRCIVFDFDGVLVDSNRIKRDAYRQVLQHRGASSELLEACLASHPEADRTEIITALLHQLSQSGAAPDDAEVARYVGDYGAVCLAEVSVCPEVTGASATLEALGADYPLYINSATPEEPLKQIVAVRGWSRRFRGVMGRPYSKSENFARILTAEQIPAEAMLFVGDRQPDRAAAQACGCVFVGVRSDESDFSEPGPLLIDTLEGLPSLVRGLGKD
jgi:phosphoglycolate phosphatase-like HAD superfamily hydrolase